MQTMTTAINTVLRVSWLIQLVLGLLFWTGNALSLIQIHMWNGYLLVLLLWALAVLAAISGVNPGLVAFAVAWGIIVPFVGLNQARWLIGDLHWIVQVFHLLLGIGLGVLGDTLAQRIRQSAAQHPAPST
jgi:hypothetical protein